MTLNRVQKRLMVGRKKQSNKQRKPFGRESSALIKLDSGNLHTGQPVENLFPYA